MDLANGKNVVWHEGNCYVRANPSENVPTVLSQIRTFEDCDECLENESSSISGSSPFECCLKSHLVIFYSYIQIIDFSMTPDPAHVDDVVAVTFVLKNGSASTATGGISAGIPNWFANPRNISPTPSTISGNYLTWNLSFSPSQEISFSIDLDLEKTMSDTVFCGSQPAVTWILGLMGSPGWLYFDSIDCT